MQPHRGTMILVFGILGLVCCIIFGILAWIMGNNDLKEMDAGRKDPSGRGLTQAGKILGMVACILAIIGVIIQIIVLALGGGMMVFSSY
jgi:ABC-type Fe3+ transport system permease subunit